MGKRAGRVGPGLLAVLVLVAAPLGAQENRMGFMGGATIATWAGDDTHNPDDRVGFDVGAFVSWVVDEPWALRGGISYVQKGIEEDDAEGEAELNLEYLEFPLLLEYRLSRDGVLGAHLFAGPAVALQLGCHVDLGTRDDTVPVRCDLLGMYPRRVDVGAMLGAGLTLAAFDRFDFLLEASYNLGIGSIDSSPARADVKNRAFQVNAGIVISTGEWLGTRGGW